MMEDGSNGYQGDLGDSPVSMEVVNIICEQYGVGRADVYRGSTLFDDFAGKRDDLTSIGTQIEDRFDLSPGEVGDDILDGWQTVEDVVDYVISLVGE
jgi:acyl carrier protein